MNRDEGVSKQIVRITPMDKSLLKRVWSKMRQGVTLQKSEVYIGRSMAEHPDWFPIFETIGLLDGDDELDDGTNPFEHITLHVLIGAQIFHRQPPQATDFYMHRLSMGEESHDIAHIMIEVFTSQLEALASQGLEPGDFDHLTYGKTLASLKKLTQKDLWSTLGYTHIPNVHSG